MQILNKNDSQESPKSIDKMRSSFGNSFAKHQSMVELQKSPKAHEGLANDMNVSSISKLNVMKLAQVSSLEELR